MNRSTIFKHTGNDGPCRSVAERRYPTSEVRGSGQEELYHIRGPGGGWEELPDAQGQGQQREEQPHVQGTVAAWAQEGQEELLHDQDQEGQP